MNEYVYVGQLNNFWRLSPEEWRQLCRRGVNGEKCDLSQYRKLKTRPNWLRKNSWGQGYFKNENQYHYYEPTDWTKTDYEAALKELDSEN